MIIPAKASPGRVSKTISVTNSRLIDHDSYIIACLITSLSNRSLCIPESGFGSDEIVLSGIYVKSPRLRRN